MPRACRAAATSSSTQTRMYIVTGTVPGSRPARAAPSSIRARLTTMCSGVAQLSSAPSAVSPASLSICGPSAARYTGAGGRSCTPSDAERGQPGVPAGGALAGGALAGGVGLVGRDHVARQQRADLGDVGAHHGDGAVRQADRGPEPGPVTARSQAEDESAGGELGQRGRLRREAQRGPHPHRRDDGDPGAQRGVLRPCRADVERVRHAAGRGPQALETELPGLPCGLSQLGERQAEPGI